MLLRLFYINFKLEDFEDVQVNGLGFKDDSAFLEYVFVVTIKNPLIYNEDLTFKD